MALKPGENSSKNGGIYVEVGPRGGAKDNFVTIADNKTASSTQNPKSHWKLAKRTPNSRRKQGIKCHYSGAC